MRLLVVNSHPRSNSRELICAVLACFEGELKMKKVSAILFFLFLLAAGTAYGFPLLPHDNGNYHAADYSDITYPLEPVPISTAAMSEWKTRPITRNHEESNGQDKVGDDHKHGHNHDHEAKSKYDLRNIDGKHGSDGHKHAHEHADKDDHKPKSKYDLRETDGHDHKHCHKHDHGDAHQHGHGEDHKHGHGDGHNHEHGEAHHHHGEAHGHDHGEGHDHGHGQDGDEGGHHHDEEGPEGLYDRLWDVVTLG